MKKIFPKFLHKILFKNSSHELKIPSDFEEHHIKTLQLVKENTMTSPERIFSLIEAVKYIERNNIDGDIVECGVWKGGSMMTVAHTLISLDNTTRSLYLYDTYEGMNQPTDHDKVYSGESAINMLERNKDKEKNLVWAYSPLSLVEENLASTKYPSEKIHFVKGKVEDTIPNTLPSSIAILRLDTDWYESTKHELIHLFPNLVAGGVLILDDYGYWQGARKAVDEYITENNIKILLNRIDETGRIGIKQ